MTSAWPPPPGGDPWAAPDPRSRVAPAAPVAPPPSTATCYRHQGRGAPVSCARCDRPICTDCMVSAAVGWQCPSCAKDGTRVLRADDIRGGGIAAGERPPVTSVLIGVSLLVFVLGFVVGGGGDPLSGATGLANDLGLNGSAVAAGEWWRVVTSGFLHFGIIHIGFNMVLLWRLGTFLERRWGWLRFSALYAAALLGGSAGVLLLGGEGVTGGASGAVFGLMGAAFVCRGAGDGHRDPIEAGLGGLLAINLIITFVLPGISIGGHLGGLVAGALCGVALRFDRSRLHLPSLAACLAVLLAGVAVSYAAVLAL